MKPVVPILVLLRTRKLFLQLLQLTAHGAIVNRAADAHDHTAQKSGILAVMRPDFLSGGESYLRLQTLLLVGRQLARAGDVGFHKDQLVVQFSLKLPCNLRRFDTCFSCRTNGIDLPACQRDVRDFGVPRW